MRFRWILNSIFVLGFLLTSLQASRMNILIPEKAFFKVKRSWIESQPGIRMAEQLEFDHGVFYQIQVQNDEDLKKFIEKLKNLDPDIIVEPNYTYRLDDINIYNDPLLQDQWYFSYIHADYPVDFIPDTITGNVIVGIIDSGIDYLHEDLQGIFWVNEAEDINRNGILDSLDMDGIDQDNNGWIDDVIGYDFVDTPDLPSTGDYLAEDPFPDDEFLPYGHGTGVAGIIAANVNNQKGIAGIVPHAKIMNLRAGNASGILETDDIVKAIIYAVKNGAQILNMSFGDRYSSQILRAAIQYAKKNGLIIVASAGNDNSGEFHYPAAYPDVIAVAAVDGTGQKAGFSNYGDWISCTAPGVNIWTTTIQNKYHELSGTSFSAPIVTAVMAYKMLLDPFFYSDEIQTSFLTHLTDLPPTGYDRFNGHGVPVFPLILQNKREWVSIESPPRGSYVGLKSFSIVGTVLGENIESFSMQLIVENETLWQKEYANHFFYRDTIDTIPENVIRNGHSVIRIVLHRFDQSEDEFFFPFEIFVPESQQFRLTRNLIVDGDLVKYQYVLATEFPTTAQLDFLDEEGRMIFSVADGVEDSLHFFYSSIDRYHSVAVSLFDYQGQMFQQFKTEAGIPAGTAIQTLEAVPRIVLASDIQFRDKLVIFPQLKNLDTDLSFEILATNPNQNYRLEVIDFPNYPALDSVRYEKKSEIPLLPYGVGDINGDQKPDILAGFAGKCYIISGEEVLRNDSLIRSFSFQDTLDCWPVGIDSLNGMIYVRKNNVYQIWKFDRDWQKQIIKTFMLDSANLFSKPKILTGHFTQSPEKEYIIGDYDGRLYLFRESVGKIIIPLDTFSTGIPNILGYAISMDLDRDSLDEIYCLVKSDFGAGSDIRAGEIFWDVYRIKLEDSDGIFQLTNIVRLKGNPDEASLSTGIWPVPNRFGFFINCGNNTYFISKQDTSFQIEFTIAGSSQPWPFYDRYLGQEYLVGMTRNIPFISIVSSLKTVVFPDVRLLQKSDSTYFLHWNYTGTGKDSALIFIYQDGQKSDSLDIVSGTTGEKEYGFVPGIVNTIRMDLFLRLNGKLFLIQQNTIDLHPITSPEIRILSKNGMLELYHPLGFTAQYIQPADFQFVRKKEAGAHLFFAENFTRLYITFPSPFSRFTKDSLRIYHLKDQKGGDLSGVYPVEIPGTGFDVFYPKNAILNRDTLIVTFDRPLVRPEFTTENFVTIPPSEIVNYIFHEAKSNQIKLVQKNWRDLFRSGARPMIQIIPFYSDSILMAEGHTVTLPIIKEMGNLTQMEIFPNPLFAFRQDKLHILGLPFGAKVSILSINGEIIFSAEEREGSGSLVLDLNKSLVNLPTGVYIIAVRAGKDSVIRKWFYIK
jgi:hypothetical protein